MWWQNALFTIWFLSTTVFLTLPGAVLFLRGSGVHLPNGKPHPGMDALIVAGLSYGFLLIAASEGWVVSPIRLGGL